MADVTVIGHIAIDKIITNEGSRIQLGGPPTYMTLIAGLFGNKLDVITKVGKDIPKKLLSKASYLGMDLQGMTVEGAFTTRFILDYRGLERTLKVESVCEKITLEDIAEVQDAVLVTPIIGEIYPEMLDKINSEIIALDPQGFLREILDDGNIRLKPWLSDETLGTIEVFKSSLRELEVITGYVDPWRGLEYILDQGVNTAIATRGAQGSLLATKTERFIVPAYKTVSIDPTGAGDAFLGSFFLEYLNGEDLLWCASMGASAASFVVETIGPEIRANRKDLEERAEKIINDSKRF
jgi:sugar/nucleoside kinase (ribokinase family)